MKKIALISLLCLVMFTATGCKKFSYEFSIDKKGNVTISETDAMNMSVIESFVSAEQIESKLAEATTEMEGEGYEVTVYNDGTFKGLTRKNKEKINVETFKREQLPVGFSLAQPQPVVFDKEFLKNKYTIKWQYNLQQALDKDNEKNGSTAEDEYLPSDEGTRQQQQMMQDVFAETVKPIADLKITIPYRAVSHNANKADKIENGFEYTWDLSNLEEPISIELAYEKVDYTGSIMVLTFIFLFVGLFLFFLKAKEESF